MEFFIIIIIIFLSINSGLKKNASSRLIPLLEEKGFKNISVLHTSNSFKILSCIYNGDNYAVLLPNSTIPIDMGMLNTFIDFSAKSHLHNKLIIVSQNPISERVTKNLKQYEITLLDYNKIKNIDSYTFNKTIYTKEIEDNCDIDASFDPIQDGKNKTSILGGLFNKNKIERL